MCRKRLGKAFVVVSRTQFCAGPVRRCRQAVGHMWIYVALGISVLVAFNAVIVAVVTVAAQHAHAEPREELEADLRQLLLSHVRVR